MNRTLKYSAALIGGYLVLAYATGFGTAIKAAGTAGSGLVKTFQGR